MKTVHWSAIAEDVRVRLNLPAYASSALISLPIISDFIRQSADELAGMVGQGMGDGFNTEIAFLQLPAGTNQVSLVGLGANGIQKVSHAVRAGEYVQLFRATNADVLASGTEHGDWGSSVRITYRLRGAYLELYPYPLHDVTISVVYDKGFDIPADLDSYDVLEPGWREWIVNDVCARCAVRQKNEPGYHAANRDRVWNTIIEPGFGRDENAIQQVRDLRGEGDEDFSDAMFRRGR